MWSRYAGGRRRFLHPERRPRTQLVQRCRAEKHPLQSEEETTGLQPRRVPGSFEAWSVDCAAPRGTTGLLCVCEDEALLQQKVVGKTYQNVFKIRK